MKNLLTILFVVILTQIGFGQSLSMLKTELILKEDDKSNYQIVIHNEETKDSVQIDITSSHTKIKVPLNPGNYMLTVVKDGVGDLSIVGITIKENQITFIPNLDYTSGKYETKYTKQKKKRKRK